METVRTRLADTPKLFVGAVVGRLTVIAPGSGKLKASGARMQTWVCECLCGGTLETLDQSLRSGGTRSCGCLSKTAHTKKHAHCVGRQQSRTYRSWRDMVQRCTNPNLRAWKNYGGRGITVCDRWKKFPAFLADMGECPPGLTLDRIDTDKGYEPENCRWADWATQARNKRVRGARYECRGENLTLRQWAEKLGWSRSRLLKRIKEMPLEEALFSRDRPKRVSNDT